MCMCVARVRWGERRGCREQGEGGGGRERGEVIFAGACLDYYKQRATSYLYAYMVFVNGEQQRKDF